MGTLDVATSPAGFSYDLFSQHITPKETHLRAEVFLNNRNESSREKHFLPSDTVGNASPLHPAIEFHFCFLQPRGFSIKSHPFERNFPSMSFWEGELGNDNCEKYS